MLNKDFKHLLCPQIVHVPFYNFVVPVVSVTHSSISSMNECVDLKIVQQKIRLISIFKCILFTFASIKFVDLRSYN